MKRIYQRLKEYTASLFTFNKSVEQVVPKQSKTYKAIEYVKTTKNNLRHLLKKYNQSIEQLDTKANNKQVLAGNKYIEYQDSLKKYRNGIISEEVLQAVEKDLNDSREEARDAEAELERVQGFRGEDSLQFVKEIRKEEDAYTAELAEHYKEQAETVKQLRQDYINSIVSLGENFKDATDTDELLQDVLNGLGYSYKGQATDKLTAKTENSEMTMNDLIINHETIKEALQGKSEYKSK